MCYVAAGTYCLLLFQTEGLGPVAPVWWMLCESSSRFLHPPASPATAQVWAQASQAGHSLDTGRWPLVCGRHGFFAANARRVAVWPARHGLLPPWIVLAYAEERR